MGLFSPRPQHLVLHHAASKKARCNEANKGHAHQNTQFQGDGPVIQKFHDGFSEGIGADAPEDMDAPPYRQTIESSLLRRASGRHLAERTRRQYLLIRKNAAAVQGGRIKARYAARTLDRNWLTA
jgi:hypothetical protein